jgi:serine/threonine protein kinase
MHVCLQRVATEISVLQDLQHPLLPKLHQVYTTGEELCMEMTLCSRGTLWHARRDAGGKLPVDTVSSCAAGPPPFVWPLPAAPASLQLLFRLHPPSVALSSPAPSACNTLKVRQYAAELVCVLAHLHDNGAVYVDLKPENVLIQVCVCGRVGAPQLVFQA